MKASKQFAVSPKQPAVSYDLDLEERRLLLDHNCSRLDASFQDLRVLTFHGILFYSYVYLPIWQASDTKDKPEMDKYISIYSFLEKAGKVHVDYRRALKRKCPKSPLAPEKTEKALSSIFSLFWNIEKKANIKRSIPSLSTTYLADDKRYIWNELEKKHAELKDFFEKTLVLLTDGNEVLCKTYKKRLEDFQIGLQMLEKDIAFIRDKTEIAARAKRGEILLPGNDTKSAVGKPITPVVAPPTPDGSSVPVSCPVSCSKRESHPLQSAAQKKKDVDPQKAKSACKACKKK